MDTRYRRFRALSVPSFSILIALAAGCAMPTSPVADAPAKPDEAAKPSAVADANAAQQQQPVDDAAARVTIDSVNDSVARVDRLLAQRAQAKQLADDIAEQRAARGEAKPAKEDEAAEIERLAAELRKPKAAEPKPEPAVAALPANAVTPANAGTSADAAVAASDAQGTLESRPQVELQRAPNVDAHNGVDPMLAVLQRYQGRVARDPKSLDAQLEYQLLRFLRNESVPEGTDLAALPSDDRELLSAVTDALTNFRSVVRAGPNAMAAEKARPFIDMADRIRSRSDLTVSSLSLCRKVMAYGVYEPIEPLRFVAGPNNRAVVYCEVDGFLSQLNDKSLWGTELWLGLRLFSESNLELWTPPLDKVTDVSRKRRRDFFIAKPIQLPAILTPGRYFLKATVEDRQAHRVAEQTIQIDIYAQ